MERVNCQGLKVPYLTWESLKQCKLMVFNMELQLCKRLKCWKKSRNSLIQRNITFLPLNKALHAPLWLQLGHLLLASSLTRWEQPAKYMEELNGQHVETHSWKNYCFARMINRTPNILLTKEIITIMKELFSNKKKSTISEIIKGI